MVKIVGEKRGSRSQLNLGLVWDTCVRVERVMPGGEAKVEAWWGRGPKVKVELN